VSQIFLPQVLKDLKSTKMAVSSDGIYVAHVMGGSDLYVFNLATMEHLHTFRASAKLVDVCFFPGDRNMIYALAQNGAVYEWDMTRRAEQSQFYDDGCVQATCATISPNGQFIACGSNTGIINVYEMHSAFGKAKKEEESVGGEQTWCGRAESPKPLYSLPNLTTSALFLRFNQDAQMMAFGSSVKHMAGRVLHCRSGDVFQNFPARQEMFEKERFKCAEFSPNSAFLAMGMESGGTRLYRLHHFEGY